jgi:hypothetical protein
VGRHDVVHRRGGLQGIFIRAVKLRLVEVSRGGLVDEIFFATGGQPQSSSRAENSFYEYTFHDADALWVRK